MGCIIMKKFLFLILSLIMSISLTSVTISQQVFAAELRDGMSEIIFESKDLSEFEITTDSAIRIDDYSNGALVQNSVSVPTAIVVVDCKFLSSSSFRLTAKNIGVATASSVKYDITAYNSSGKVIGGEIVDAGALSPMGTLKDTFYYTNVDKVKVKVTVTVKGVPSTSSNTFKRK